MTTICLAITAHNEEQALPACLRSLLRSVEAALRSFEQFSAEKQHRLGWKRWVKQRAGPGVTLNFITRAINGGELKAPKLNGRR